MKLLDQWTSKHWTTEPLEHETTGPLDHSATGPLDHYTMVPLGDLEMEQLCSSNTCFRIFCSCEPSPSVNELKVIFQHNYSFPGPPGPPGARGGSALGFTRTESSKDDRWTSNHDVSTTLQQQLPSVLQNPLSENSMLNAPMQRRSKAPRAWTLRALHNMSVTRQLKIPFKSAVVIQQIWKEQHYYGNQGWWCFHFWQQKLHIEIRLLLSDTNECVVAVL